MKKSKFAFLTTQQFVLLVYFIITTIIFLLALKQGKNGITLKIFGGGGDGFFYWQEAQNVAAGRPWIRTSIYPLIIGNLIKITGIESPYIVRLFNYFGFILLTLSSLYLIKMQFKNEIIKSEDKYIYNSQIILLIAFLCYASLQMNVNLSIIRDIWIYTLYVFSVLFSVKVIFYKKNKIVNFIALLLTLWFLGEFRKYALVAFILSVLIYIVHRRVKFFRKPVRIIYTMILFFGIYYTFLREYQIPIVNISLASAMNYRLASLTTYSGGSQMWINLDQPNFIMFMVNYMYSYVSNLLGPLPWHISGISTLFVFVVETIPMVLILSFLWKKRRLLTQIQQYILLHAFVWISLIAVTNDNLGTASRLRPVAWILILSVFCVIYSKKTFLRTKN